MAATLFVTFVVLVLLPAAAKLLGISVYVLVIVLLIVLFVRVAVRDRSP